MFCSFKARIQAMPKDKIHPKYDLATVACACGNTFQTRTTQGDMKVELCNVCHPFFTGRQKQIFTTGRVDRFYKKYAKGEK
jgi:large subunit ribosomal protein L31